MGKINEKPKKYEERLMETLGFDESDLDANRDGELSAAQRIQINKARRQTLWMWGLLILFLSAALAAWLGVIRSLGIVSAETILIPIAVYVLASLASYFPFGLNSRHLLADIQANQVAQVEGRVDLSLKTDQNKARYFMRVDNTRFPLKKSAFLVFKNGDPYRIYYAPRSKRILSIEWLREADPGRINETAEDQTATQDELISFEPQKKAKRQ